MKENNKNDLNDFFKSRLQDATPADNGWNVPPMSILDDALDQLPQSPKRNKLLIPFITLGFVALGLMMMSIINSLEISNLNGKIENLNLTSTNTTSPEENSADQELNQTMSKSQPSSTTDFNSSEEVSTETQTKKSINSTKKPSITDYRETYSVPSQPTSADAADRLSFAQEVSNQSRFSSTFKEINTAKANHLVTQKTILTEIKKAENQLLLNLPLLSNSLHIDFAVNHPELYLADNLSLTTRSSHKENLSKRKFALLITGGHLGTDIRMTNINPSTFTLTEYDSFYPGVGFKIGVSTPLSTRLSLSAMLGYNRLRNNSQYESDFIYDEDNTIESTTGEMMHLSNSTVETPMGRFSDEVELELSDEQIPNGEILDQVTAISDTYQIAHFSTALSVEVLRYKKFSLQTGIGLSANYILDVSEALDTKMLSQSDVKMKKAVDVNLTPDINRLFLSGSLKLGVKYNLSQSVFLQLDSRYEKGLTSIRKQTSSDLPKSYLNSIASEMTIGYSF